MRRGRIKMEDGRKEDRAGEGRQEGRGTGEIRKEGEGAGKGVEGMTKEKRKRKER